MLASWNWYIDFSGANCLACQATSLRLRRDGCHPSSTNIIGQSWLFCILSGTIHGERYIILKVVSKADVDADASILRRCVEFPPSDLSLQMLFSRCHSRSPQLRFPHAIFSFRMSVFSMEKRVQIANIHGVADWCVRVESHALCINTLASQLPNYCLKLWIQSAPEEHASGRTFHLNPELMSVLIAQIPRVHNVLTSINNWLVPWHPSPELFIILTMSPKSDVEEQGRSAAETYEGKLLGYSYLWQPSHPYYILNVIS